MCLRSKKNLEMKITSPLIPFVLMLFGCSSGKVEITNEYIINENWSKQNEEAFANSITIDKMKVKKDSIIDPFSDLDQGEILRKLEKDPSFMHYANVKISKWEGYKNKKIYFNRNNGFYWGSKSRFNSDDTTTTIGNLKPISWYRFTDLGAIAQIYVYVDSTNKVHRFDVNLANY